MKKANLKPSTHLREIEESWFTEKYVSQINSPTSQHLNLVFTEMMTSQKLTKVPAHRQQQSVIKGQQHSRHLMNLLVLAPEVLYFQ